MTTNELGVGYTPDEGNLGRGRGEEGVVGKRKAPKLFVSYRCPKTSCSSVAVLDAYKGPPTCQNRHAPQFMEAMFLVKGMGESE